MLRKHFREQKGSFLVLSTMFAFSMLVFTSVAVDVGCILTAKNQLQTSVDASALATASGLIFSQSTAVQRGMLLSQRNTILNEPLNLQSGEITFLDPKTVQITAERPVSLFFARMVGINTARIEATATAICGNRDIMLVFDRSGSMDDDTVNPYIPQPITNTKTAANYFVNLIESNSFVCDRIGLVSYSTNANLNLELSRDFGLIRDQINSYTADGFTNIGEAIQFANEHLIESAQSRTKKTIILLSDGMTNQPGYGFPTNMTAINFAISNANISASNSIKIYTISLGNQTDWDLMNLIADRTNGEHYHAPTPQELYSIFNDIANRIPTILIS